MHGRFSPYCFIFAHNFKLGEIQTEADLIQFFSHSYGTFALVKNKIYGNKKNVTEKTTYRVKLQKYFF